MYSQFYKRLSIILILIRIYQHGVASLGTQNDLGHFLESVEAKKDVGDDQHEVLGDAQVLKSMKNYVKTNKIIFILCLLTKSKNNFPK